MTDETKCITCNGKGSITRSIGIDAHRSYGIRTCSNCRGTGWVPSFVITDKDIKEVEKMIEIHKGKK